MAKPRTKATTLDYFFANEFTIRNTNISPLEVISTPKISDHKIISIKVESKEENSLNFKIKKNTQLTLNKKKLKLDCLKFLT